MSGIVSRIAVSWRARGTIALVGFGERSRFKIKMFSLWTVGHAGPFFHMKTIRHALGDCHEHDFYASLFEQRVGVVGVGWCHAQRFADLG